jgi:hypothetical protein
MSTYDEFTHLTVLKSLNSFSTLPSATKNQLDALQVYNNTIQSLYEPWSNKKVCSSQQSTFIARCCAYISVFRHLVLAHGNTKKDSETPQFSNLPDSFPILGLAFYRETPPL